MGIVGNGWYNERPRGMDCVVRGMCIPRRYSSGCTGTDQDATGMGRDAPGHRRDVPGHRRDVPGHRRDVRRDAH